MPCPNLCGLADGAAWPIKNAIRKFRGEFEEYIKRTNPSGYSATDAAPSLDYRSNGTKVVPVQPSWWPSAHSHH